MGAIMVFLSVEMVYTSGCWSLGGVNLVDGAFGGLLLHRIMVWYQVPRVADRQAKVS